jgi:hypothetical protein
VHPPTALSQTRPLSYVDIYIDDFIGLAQQPITTTTLCTLLHAIDSVFRNYPHPLNHPNCKQIISAMIILGWLLDTAAGTIALPPHKAARLQELLRHFLLGELRHLSIALKGAAYLLSILQSVLVDQPNASRLHLHPTVHASLHDWDQLAHILHTHPMPIVALVPHAPQFIGAVNASGDGIGGFWIPTRHGILAQLIAFRWQFPIDL